MILILTDPRGHSRENSIYALAKELIRQYSGEVWIAARGTVDNAPFFAAQRRTIHAVRVTDSFAFDPDGRYFTTGSRAFSIADFSLVWLRLPRPITDDWLLWLKAESAGRIVNDPAGIIETGSKEFLLNFPEHCPKVKLCHTVDEVEKFAATTPAVLKPLREYGGRGIVRIEAGRVQEGSTWTDWADFVPELKQRLAQSPILAMEFLKNVDQGDKRILWVNGKVLGASLRLPAPGSWLCNVAQGGQSVPATVDSDEQRILEGIGPELLQRGIVFAGIDTLVGNDGRRVLSEINTLSIGGFPQAQAQSGEPVVALAVAGLLAVARV